MMKIGLRWFYSGALALTLVSAAAQAPAPIMKHTFEDGDGGWTGLTFPSGVGTKVSIASDAANVKNGKFALKFDYAISKGEFNVLFLQNLVGTLTKAKTLRFWAKSDYTTTCAMVLQEQNGGRYNAVFYLPKDTWQHVELSPSDFYLSEEKDDPQDSNNKLDMDQVEAIAIGDFGQFFAQIDNADLAKLFNAKTGAHVLYLDDITVTEETLSNSVLPANGGFRIDTFAHPQLAWIGVGDVKLSKVTGKPQEGPGIQADYRQAPQKIIGLLRRLPRGKLAGTERLTFAASSTKKTMLIVQVEEKGGGKFNTTIEIPAGGAVTAVNLNFAEMTPADDSSVKDRKVVLENVSQIVLIDLTGMMTNTEEDNTLWIGPILATATK